METNQWSTFNAKQILAYQLPQPSRYDMITSGNTITFADRHMDCAWDNDGECFQVVYSKNYDRFFVDRLKHFINQRQVDNDEDDSLYYGAQLSVPLYKFGPVADTE